MPMGPPHSHIVGETSDCHGASTPMRAQSLPMPASPVLFTNLPKSRRTTPVAPARLPVAAMTVPQSPTLPQWPAVEMV